MRSHSHSRKLWQLATAILLAPRSVVAKPNVHPSLKAGFTFNELFARYDCSGTVCGWNGQLCCNAGYACYTNAADQADCSATAGVAATTGGYWQLYTTTIVQTDLQTITTVMSTYVGSPSPTTTAQCQYALNETPCGNTCCASNEYCYQPGTCAPAPGGGSTGYQTGYTTPGAPLRGTSSGVTVVTATQTPTTTIPFEPPVATGANVTITSEHHSSGLSGGAIAGIVIGVLVGLALLALLCFYCCIKGLIDGLLACFGLGGRRRRRTTEVDEYERRSHHTSRTGGRNFFGVARPPARVSGAGGREERRQSEGRTILGIGAGLAALWAILGLKRRRDNNRRRQEEKYSEYSYSSDYYTSASSASSDRRTRETRRSVSRR